MTSILQIEGKRELNGGYMIESKNIDVVVQGIINENSKRCIKSIREKLPESNIIISTWGGKTQI